VEVGLGVVWAAATVAAVYGGPIWLAIWLAPVAALAAASTLHSWGGGRSRQRAALVAAVVSAAVILAGVAGLWAAAAVALVGAGVVAAPALLSRRLTRSDKYGPGAWRRMAIVIGPAAGCAGAVVARTYGLDQALVLVGMVCIYDSAAYLIGTGANNAWEGPVAGVASVGALTLLVAAVFFTPFRGNSPWILGALAAVLAPLGPAVARRFTSDPTVRVPPLRRLDSLVLLGPAWAVGVRVLLHH
jgi:hypothetical protein